MVVLIGIIKKENFNIENYDEVLKPHFKEFLHRNIPYMRIITFEKYGMSNTFEHVFYSEDEFNLWLVEVPISISKLQAIKHLRAIGKYDELMAILDSDPTGDSRILFDAAHVLDRVSNMVNQIGQALQMSSNDIDDFFVDASEILV